MPVALRRSTVLVPFARRQGLVRVGSETDTAPAASSALASVGMVLPILSLSAVGAVVGGTLWGLTGLLGGTVLGAGAGFGVAKLAGSSSKAAASMGDGGNGDGGGAGSYDFDLPKPGSFKPVGLGEFPTTVFSDAPTFLPTPSIWLPVSVQNSRARVSMHRDLPEGAEITFIAQYGIRDINDTTDEIKLSGKIVVARKALEDRDPAYGVEVTELLTENKIGPTVPRPLIGQRMVVAPDQVLTSNTDLIGEAKTGVGIIYGSASPMLLQMTQKVQNTEFAERRHPLRNVGLVQKDDFARQFPGISGIAEPLRTKALEQLDKILFNYLTSVTGGSTTRLTHTWAAWADYLGSWRRDLETSFVGGGVLASRMNAALNDLNVLESKLRSVQNDGVYYWAGPWPRAFLPGGRKQYNAYLNPSAVAKVEIPSYR